MAVLVATGPALESPRISQSNSWGAKWHACTHTYIYMWNHFLRYMLWPFSTWLLGRLSMWGCHTYLYIYIHTYNGFLKEERLRMEKSTSRYAYLLDWRSKILPKSWQNLQSSIQKVRAPWRTFLFADDWFASLFTLLRASAFPIPSKQSIQLFKLIPEVTMHGNAFK